MSGAAKPPSAWGSPEFKARWERIRQLIDEASAVLGVERDDAKAMVVLFEDHPELRRGKDCLSHCAAVLRERRDLLAPRQCERIERAYAAVAK